MEKTKIDIRTAENHEFHKVQMFYHSMIDAMEHTPYTPGWQKGVYPSDQYLIGSIARRELYIGFLNAELVAAMIVNHESNESYANAHWPTEADKEEITVLHALGVRHDFGGRGIAKEMVNKVIAMAREGQQKVIRLDVLKGNLPAERLYTGMGFQYVDTLQMYYEDTGWTDYMLYEYGPIVNSEVTI